MSRDIQVKVLQDCDSPTHVCQKGAILWMDSIVAEPLIADGKLEVFKEVAVAKPVAEKRG